MLETRRELSGTEDPDPLAQYVWHPYTIDAILLRDYDSDTDGSSVRFYYTQDVNFNVTSLISSSGTVLERYGYTPYGQAEVLTASFTADPDGKSDSDNDITYTGQRYDAESGLMLFRRRYYHPVIGTFCSRDPIGYRGSKWNLYEYVGGNPVDFVDSYGMSRVGEEGYWLRRTLGVLLHNNLRSWDSLVKGMTSSITAYGYVHPD